MACPGLTGTRTGHLASQGRPFSQDHTEASFQGRVVWGLEHPVYPSTSAVCVGCNAWCIGPMSTWSRHRKLRWVPTGSRCAGRELGGTLYLSPCPLTWSSARARWACPPCRRGQGKGRHGLESQLSSPRPWVPPLEHRREKSAARSPRLGWDLENPGQ